LRSVPINVMRIAAQNTDDEKNENCFEAEIFRQDESSQDSSGPSIAESLFATMGPTKFEKEPYDTLSVITVPCGKAEEFNDIVKMAQAQDPCAISLENDSQDKPEFIEVEENEEPHIKYFKNILIKKGIDCTDEIFITLDNRIVVRDAAASVSLLKKCLEARVTDPTVLKCISNIANEEDCIVKHLFGSYVNAAENNEYILDIVQKQIIEFEENLSINSSKAENEAGTQRDDVEKVKKNQGVTFRILP